MTAGVSSSAPSPPWIDLPRDVTANILRRLGPEEMLNTAERVCSTWRSVCCEPSLWRVIHMKSYRNVDSLCRTAVDRSQGELIDVNIKHSLSDDLVRYVSERSSNLKILSLENCWYLSGKGLTTALKSIPRLEELHLYFMLSIRAVDIDTIGVSCPMLKSLTLYGHPRLVPFYDMDFNSEAESIAKKMPNLVRLRLCGNSLNNQGLLAILNGCPKLESLDLKGCLYVKLDCDLRRRCSKQIKELRCPGDYKRDDRFYDPDDRKIQRCYYVLVGYLYFY